MNNIDNKIKVIVKIIINIPTIIDIANLGSIIIKRSLGSIKGIIINKIVYIIHNINDPNKQKPPTT